MKWFQEGDFNVRGASDYDTTGYQNSQHAVNQQIRPGEVVDSWDQNDASNTEVQIGGETEFGGWLSDDERRKASGMGTKKSKQAMNAMRQNALRGSLGIPVSKKSQAKEREFGSGEQYEDWLTSRNNYARRP